MNGEPRVQRIFSENLRASAERHRPEGQITLKMLRPVPPTPAGFSRNGADKAPVEYIVYPGENRTSDFNVRRNTWHNLGLLQGRESDNRVLVYDGKYYGTANCHICTGDQVTFDVTPYQHVSQPQLRLSEDRAGNEYARHPAGLLWQDNKIVLVHACGQPSYDAAEQSAGQCARRGVRCRRDDSLNCHMVPARRSAAGARYTTAGGNSSSVMDRIWGHRYGFESPAADVYTGGAKIPLRRTRSTTPQDVRIGS